MDPNARAAEEPLVRQLSAIGLWLLVINGMIGAGIFGVPAEAARLAGTFSPWVFVICAVLVLPIMLCFAELASYFSVTGGPVLYAGTAFGPIAGFQAGWAFYVARLTAFAANLNLLVNSVAYLWAGAAEPFIRAVFLLVICALMALVNIMGAQDAMRSLGVLTTLKFLPLIALVALGLLQLDPASLLPTAGSIPASADLGAAVLLAIYAYVGFESGLVPAGEARHPTRDIPRALLWALAVSTALYVLIQAVSITVLPSLGATSRPLVEVAAVLIGPVGALLMMAGVIASVAGNLVGSMFSTPRITYRLALDGLLPRWFGAVHPTYRTPNWSILFFAGTCYLLAVTGSFVWLVGLSVLTRILLYLGCIGAMPPLRQRFGDVPASLRLPGGYALPVLSVMVCLGLLTQVGRDAWLVTASFLAVGSGLFLASPTRRG